MNLQSTTERKIHLLPEHIVDQIKAGEVVERPSALLKELMENSIDAGSSRIDVQIRDNGLELISIEDNGEGMDMEDLPYAFCRHATSKITQFDDLYRLHSYGFRGEALASISSIARVTCTSAPKSDSSRGGKIVFHGGKQEEWSPLPSTTNGTSFFVKDLFFNTPARLKFLKSKSAEKNALQRVFNAFLLTHPEVSFSIKWDDKEKILFPACKAEDVNKRIAKVFFKKNPDSVGDLVEINQEYEGTRLTGFYSSTTGKGPAGKQQYFFVNGRLFVDKALHQAFLRTIEGVWPHGEYGHYCFFIDLPPDQVDVNVHPGKIHVKFLKPSVVFGLISGCVKKPEVEREFQETSIQDISPESLWNTYSGDLQGDRSKDQKPTAFGGQKVFNVQDGFILYRDEEGPAYLINTNKFLRKYLEISFESHRESPTPLLIGEALPFPKGQIDKKLHQLDKLGFELDRVDNETIILRAVPQELIYFDHYELLNPILRYLDNNEDFQIEPLLTTIEATLFSSLKPSRFESLWKRFEEPTKIFNDSILTLDAKKLQELL